MKIDIKPILDLIHDKADHKPIISVVGPTCTGKTAVSILLAKQLGLEIINADSRLVFSEMDVGTAKPTALEMDGVKHHLVDIRKPDEIYSSGEYQKDFDSLISEKKQAVVVGGTGMYLSAALENLTMPEVGQDLELRAELEKMDLLELCNELEDRDPEAYAQIDLNNKRRVVRALEVIKLSGKKFSAQSKKSADDRYPVLWLGLNDSDRELLYDRINNRVYKMMDAGLLNEVEALYKKYGATKTLMNTIGYGELIRYLDGDYSLDDAIALIQKKTRNYAKRQLTWFRGNPRIHWIGHSLNQK